MEELGRKFPVCIPETLVGNDASNETGNMLSERGFHKTLIVTDGDIVKAGLVEPIEASLRTKGASKEDHP